MLGFFKEVSIYAKALKKVTKAIKINYEIHGNSLPHLHLHLYPRYRIDPFPGAAINYNKKSAKIYGEGEFERFVMSLKQEIQKLIENK